MRTDGLVLRINEHGAAFVLDSDTGSAAEGLLDIHLGVGDAIICNGLIRTLAERGRPLVLPVWRRNIAAIESLFSDLTNVRLLPLDEEPRRYVGPGVIEMRNKVVADGSGSFDEHFYRKVGVPFDKRYSAFKIPASTPQLSVTPWPYVLIHGRNSEGREIDHDLIRPLVERQQAYIRHDGTSITRVEAYNDAAIGRWCDLIQFAAEIHCIDSAFIHLVDSVPSNGKLFFHSYARPRGSAPFRLRKDWVVYE